MDGESDSSVSQGSSGSLTAGDVLVRSTSVHREQPLGAGGRPKAVTVAVKKLRGASSADPAARAALGRGGTAAAAPASLPGRAPCGRPAGAVAGSAARGTAAVGTLGLAL